MGMARIINLSNDNPKLRGRALRDGTISLYLDYYDGCDYKKDKATGKVTRIAKRKTEWLKIYLIDKPRNASERFHNDEALRIADGIKRERNEQLLKSKSTEAMVVDDFYDYYQKYIDDYTKKDCDHIERALRDFKNFLGSSSKYRSLARKIRPDQIKKPVLEGFAEYIMGMYEGSGPHTLWARFKKVLKHAYEDGVFDRPPYLGVKVPCGVSKVKDVLTLEEIKLLASTHYAGENQRVREAFIFCCCTGLRFCDVVALNWSCLKDDKIIFQQQKVAHSSSHSVVALDLTEYLSVLIGNRPANTRDTDAIFRLPTHTTCLSKLRDWCAAAGINKHITWHCARHSFGTNLAASDTDMRTIMSLLGHSSMKYTQIYVHPDDARRKAAMQSISLGVTPTAC